MDGKNAVKGFLTTLGIFLLIVDGRTALSGAEEGITLCMKTVIPGLLPFFFLTGVLNDCLLGEPIWILRPLGKLCGLPKGGESILIPAFLGGYPMGARTAAEGYQSGRIQRETAEGLLFYCSNAGPAFFFGILPSLLTDRYMAWLLYGIHIGSAVLVSILCPTVPGEIRVTQGQKHSPGRILDSSLRALGSVCGWIILFRVITAFLEKWILWRFSLWGQVLATGLLELTNGCSLLAEISDPGLQFLLAAFLSGFGGLCITMQTASVLGELSIKPYLTGKLLQSFLSLMFALSVLLHIFPAVLAVSLIPAWISLQKRGGNSSAIIV